jgi:hypothetical protein
MPPKHTRHSTKAVSAGASSWFPKQPEPDASTTTPTVPTAFLDPNGISDRAFTSRGDFDHRRGRQWRAGTDSVSLLEKLALLNPRVWLGVRY